MYSLVSILFYIESLIFLLVCLLLSFLSLVIGSDLDMGGGVATGLSVTFALILTVLGLLIGGLGVAAARGMRQRQRKPLVVVVSLLYSVAFGLAAVSEFSEGFAAHKGEVLGASLGSLFNILVAVVAVLG